MSIPEGKWGTSKRGKMVHLYQNDHISLCGTAGELTWIQDHWDIDDKLTCPVCKRMIEMMRLGFKKVDVEMVSP
jgi:hypothetical protein